VRAIIGVRTVNFVSGGMRRGPMIAMSPRMMFHSWCEAVGFANWKRKRNSHVGTFFDKARLDRCYVRTGHGLDQGTSAEESEAELRARVLAHLDCQQKPELADLRTVRSRSDLDPMMPGYVQDLF
jgi:hypothetical protein